MATEPEPSRDVNDLFARFNQWLLRARPYIGDVAAATHYLLGAPGMVNNWKRVTVVRERHLPAQGALLRAPNAISSHLTPNQWSQVPLRVVRAIEYDAARRELALLAVWLKARNCAVAPWTPTDMRAGTDGMLRRQGDHGYAFDVYVPGGTSSTLEYADVARDFRVIRKYLHNCVDSDRAIV